MKLNDLIAHVPVLVSTLADDRVHCRVVDGPDADCVAKTASEAFGAVRMALKRFGDRDPDRYWPGAGDYELQRTSVQVRLLYRDGKRQTPASRRLKIPVRYVIGRYVDGSVECFLVDYGIEFHCPAITELEQLIDEAVRYAASTMTAIELAAATPPGSSDLRMVRVRLNHRDADDDDANLETLSKVADPVGVRSRKRKPPSVEHRHAESRQCALAMTDASVLLVGDAGVGKSSIVRSAAAEFARLSQNDPDDLADLFGGPFESEPTAPAKPLVWKTSAENLIAGMQYLGQWEERVELAIAEVASIGGVLWFTSLVDLVRLGGCHPNDSLAAFLMPYLRRAELKLVAEATPQEIDAVRRLLPGLIECFQVVPVSPLTTAQTHDIIDRRLILAKRNLRLDSDDAVAETVTRLFQQFIPYQPPPRGPVQLIDDLIGRLKSSPRLTVADVTDQFTQQTGLPQTILDDAMTMSADQVRQHLGSSVMGQPTAVDTVTNVVLRLKAGLCDPRRPIATMLFCGPTGVGKTQLARSLADFLFGGRNGNANDGVRESTSPLVRLDMSEYANWDAMERLTMSADGEVASWIARLRTKPMSVVLLDEFEKASPEVHDGLLSALDEGRLTDRFGRTTTLCGAIVILTSNVGSQRSASVGFIGDDPGIASQKLSHAIEQEFRPEFLNRLDDVVLFDPLSPTSIERIVEKELRSLAGRESLAARNVTLRWDDDVVQRLASVGFDAKLGARPLQRVIEQQVVAKIARRVLAMSAGSREREIDLADLVV